MDRWNDLLFFLVIRRLYVGWSSTKVPSRLLRGQSLKVWHYSLMGQSTSFVVQALAPTDQEEKICRKQCTVVTNGATAFRTKALLHLTASLFPFGVRSRVAAMTQRCCVKVVYKNTSIHTRFYRIWTSSFMGTQRTVCRILYPFPTKVLQSAQI
ncbi:hypothetical protein PR003_g34515 [Phytophthora rubi]|uniref:Secreted protein n=1 Tax=Phytophthora rubi TaxID=129364 RepID=A0A6A4AR70_9STRA|nr:hypothetical protein PR001_g28978 [Phytophthora rubi]KAE9260092.1 hypothetical protein PR003_g34515 [Phytophthora rubi]